jgi:hypothetical protein
MDRTAGVLDALAIASGLFLAGESDGDSGSDAEQFGKLLHDKLKPVRNRPKPSNHKAFSRSDLQSVLVALLTDYVKPEMSAYKHNKLTDQGSQRLRLRVPERASLETEISPPPETISILEWVSKHIEENCLKYLVANIVEVYCAI